MAITTRAGKGSELSYAEMDTNFTDLRDGVALMVPSSATDGIKVDSLGTPTFGWHDIYGHITLDPNDGTCAGFSTYAASLSQIQFVVGEHVHVAFHMPHDYVLGTDMYIHVHWSHNSALVTGGSVTWGWYASYASGYNTMAFASPITGSVIQNASTTQFQHMIAETSLSVSGGSASQLDTDLLEVDGLVLCQLFLSSNDITSSGAVPDPFVHFIDIHYQSTGVPTKNRNPAFY